MANEADERWALWGHLADRYRDEERQHRILALDGGGIRGIISLGVLRALEAQLRERAGGGRADFRLCDYFDLIGGTSTGAIIAAALARGMSVEEISTFYSEFGRTAFERTKLWNRFKSLHRDAGLAKTLQATFEPETTLHPEHLRCLLVVVTRNATTDSAWPISSNPFAKYNALSRPDCNLNIPLWKIVRASTAAPVFFPPEVVSWDPDNPAKSFVFVDGGTTPYNNPAFLLFRMATEPAYGLGWPAGDDKLLIVSVGTGGAPVMGDTADAADTNLAKAALNTLSALMSQASVDQDINCRVVGRCTHGDRIDRELEDLIPRELADGATDRPAGERRKLFLYVRYNATLTDDGLAALGLEEVHLDPKALRKMNSVDNADALALIGARLGAQVDLAHLESFVASA
jgi:predicted acylesterase/phospholipase RssA